MTGTDTTEAREETVPPPAKEAPERLALRSPPRPVVRMSRKMIALLIGTSAIGLAGAAIWSLSHQLRPPQQSKELYNVDRVQTADGLAKLPRDYRGIEALPPGTPVLGPPLPGDLGRPIVSAQNDGRMEADPASPKAQSATAASGADRAEQVRRSHEAIRRSDIFFGKGGQAAEGHGALPQPATASTDTAATQVAPSASAIPAEGSQAAKRAFMAAEPDKRIYASADLQRPASPYQLMAGSVISAALLTGLSSDLPGDIIATVTSPVYDSVTGRHILIPQGARLIGRYDSGVGYAQSRLLLKWERLIFPDGRSILLDNLPGTDAGGHAGLKDRTDNHVDRLIGGAVLATMLGVGTTYGTQQATGDRSIVIATGDSAQGAVAQIGSEITRKNLDVQPTLTIRPGFPLKVIVERDLILPLD